MEISPETILVVEDAEAVRKMVCAMLEQSGYRCLEAVDGSDAVRVLSGSPELIDLVLTDIIMPEMSGAELASHIARRWPHTRVVFMSGYSEEAVVLPSAAFFLPKPFTPFALAEVVRRALDHPPRSRPKAQYGTQ
jgi:CheY-like chemotaxis protein